MKTYKLAILLLLLLGCLNVFPQESAFEVLLDYEKDCKISFCTETNDGHYLLVPGKCMVLKLSREGEVVKEMTYELETSGGEYEWTWISGLLDIPGDPLHHIAIAESYNGYTEIGNVFHIVKFDDDLNYDPDEVVVVDLSEEVKTYWKRKPPRFLIEEDGSICLAAHAVKWDDSECLLFVRVTPEGEKTVVLENRFNDPTFVVTDLAMLDDRYGMIVSVYRYVPSIITRKGMTYFEVSRDFEVDSVFCFATAEVNTTPLVYNNQTDSIIKAHCYNVDGNVMTWLSDNVFLLPTSAIGYRGTSSTNGAAIWKLDAQFNLLDQAFFDVYGGSQFEVLNAWNPLLVRDDEMFFCYSTYTGHLDQPQQTVICKLDTDLNLKWKRWYGGEDEYHMVNCLAPTSDGGCLLSGEGHPDPSHYYETYPYVLKITSDGYCSVPESEPLLKPFCCYPNPVDDQLHLEFSPDVTPDQVELYDLQGRLLFTQRKDLERINMEGLPSGTYSLRVVMHDGKAYSDKMVKQ